MLLEPTFSGENIVNTNNGLIPISDEEYSPLAITLPEGSFTEPFSQDLSLIEEPNVFKINEEVIDNNIDFSERIYQNNSSELNIDSDRDDTLLNTNSLLGDTLEIQSFSLFSEGQVESASAEMIPAPGELEFVGGFGDYDGGEDVTFEVKDHRNNVIETFSLTGEGQGTLYKDDEKQYIFFSDTDETTNVDISAISDLAFEDYTGDSLSIETTGSLEGGDITLNDENTEEDSGLTLRAGIDTENSVSSVFDGYTLVDFNTHREMVDINYYGQIVGNDTYSGTETFFFYDGQRVNYLPGYESSRAFGINDYNQMIGEGVSLTSDDPHVPFLVFGNGTVEEFTYGEGGAGRPSPNSSGADVVYTYDPLAHPRDINNFVEIASYQLNTLPENAPPELQPRSFEDAIFLTPGGIGAVNIGYELLNSNDSRAFGINDPGQVVGIDRSTDRAFVFDRVTKSVTNLGTLPGDDYSAAYAINDWGQIVGETGNNSGSSAFIYEDGTMKDLGISYIGDPESRVGIDINNQGQAVVTSAEGEPFIYQDGVVTNINDWLTPKALDLGYTVTEAKGINDRGQIIAQGTLEGSERGLLLNPTFKLVNRNINVGNISTFGETVLLEGAEVYLDGESIVTQGGDLGIDGRTIVNNNLAIDSSVTNESIGNPNADSADSQSGTTISGGDLAFIGTLNSNATGEQNLTIKAGAGDLLFANTVGDTNPLFNLTVEGAGSVSAIRDLTVDNELVLEVINDIATANLSATGLANISLGTIGEEIFASSGNVTTGNIEALSLEVANNGSFTAGNITTSDGFINIISLNELTVGQLTATNGGVDLISGNAGIDVSGAVQGDLGFSALAQLDINTNDITSGQAETETGFSEDVIILQSSQGAVNINGSISSYGDISLASAQNIETKSITSQDGGIALISATGIVTNQGAISSMGHMTIASAQDLRIDQKIKTKLGTISLVSTEGSITVNTLLNSGIDVGIIAQKNIRTAGILTNEGNIVLEAESGQATIDGKVASRGGDFYISGLGKVNTKNIISGGGDVSIISDDSSISTGYIRTDSESKEGNVYLEAQNNVKVAGVVNLDNDNYSIYTGDEGTVTVAHQQLRRRSTASDNFIIASINQSGSLGLIEKPNTTNSPTITDTPKPITKPPVYSPQVPRKTTPRGGNIKDLKTYLIFETFRRILDAGNAEAPTLFVGKVNPLTGLPYVNDAEEELIESLTRDQQRSIGRIITNDNIPEEERLRAEDFRVGTLNEHGCFYLVLGRQLGNYDEHDLYSLEVTGDTTDHLIIAPRGNYHFYDGKLNARGLAYTEKGQAIDSYAEVKTRHEYFEKAIDFDYSDMAGWQFSELIKMGRQIKYGNIVANSCQFEYFLSFDNNKAASAIGIIYSPQYPTMNIHYIERAEF